MNLLDSPRRLKVRQITVMIMIFKMDAFFFYVDIFMG